ncbi:MAG: hypothetical protein ACM30G_15430 [Micromonosporaceae bacterium]
MSVIRQLSLFGVEAARPEPGDLAGLLAGAGQVIRMGATARISVTVDHPWRASALVAECARRGLAATVVSTVEEHIEMRTAYAIGLAPLADDWLRGEVKLPPPGLVLDGRALRLWAESGGRYEGTTSYVLPLGAADDPAWSSVGAALAALGLRAQLVSLRTGGSSYRIVGRRRVARLAELIGDPPKQAPLGVWPS